MAIGQIRLRGQAAQSSTPQVSQAAFGAGVATALKGLARAQGDFEESEARLQGQANDRVTDAEDFDVQRRWAEQQGQWNRTQLDITQNAPENGTGMTDSRYEQLRVEQQEFLGSIPERLRDKYSVATTTAVENLTTNAYGTEYQLRNDYEVKTVGDMTGTLAGDIIAGNGTVDGALLTMENLIGSTGLSEASRVEMMESATADLYAAEFQTRLVAAATSNAPVGPADGENPVAPGLVPWQRAMLNTTAADESGGDYGIRYNGHGNPPGHFDDFSDHPRIFVERPDGRKSSAAGRYQFTATEWDRVSGIMNLQDFSPMNQDRAALYLMEERFNKQVGPGEATFQQIMQNGTDEQLLAVRTALGPTWEAFQNMPDDRFLNLFKGSNGLAGGGTGSSDVPDPWTDPRYESLPYDVRSRMAGAAQDTTSAIAQQEAGAREAMADQLRAAIASGQAGEEAVNAAIENGQINLKDQDDLYKQVSGEREARQGAERFNQAVSSGQVMANDTDNQAAAFKSMQISGVADGVSQMDPQATEQFTRSFGRTGVMPPEMSGMLLGMANSSDPRQQQYALDTMAQLQARGGDHFASAMPQDAVETVGVWNVLNKYAGPGEEAAVLQQFNNWRDPAQRQLRQQMQEEAADSMASITNDDILGDLRGGMMEKIGARLSTEVDLANLPANPAALAQLRGDYSSLYNQYYSVFGDEDKTREFVTDMVSNNWGTDTVGGGNTLMYLAPNSPASGYQPINGSYDWMRDDLVVGLDLAPDTTLELITDGQSSADQAAGRPVSYMVMTQDAVGRYVPQMGEDGLPLRVRPTPSPIHAQIAEQTLVTTNLESRRQRLDFEFSEATRQANRLFGNQDDKAAAQVRADELATRISTIDEQLEESRAVSGLAGESLTDLRQEAARLTERMETFGRRDPNDSDAVRYREQLAEVQAKIDRFEGAE
jgi:muramidase (phage lysozyme)